MTVHVLTRAIHALKWFLNIWSTRLVLTALAIGFDLYLLRLLVNFGDEYLPVSHRDLVDEAKNYLLLPQERPLMQGPRTRPRKPIRCGEVLFAGMYSSCWLSSGDSSWVFSVPVRPVFTAYFWSDLCINTYRFELTFLLVWLLCCSECHNTSKLMLILLKITFSLLIIILRISNSEMGLWD